MKKPFHTKSEMNKPDSGSHEEQDAEGSSTLFSNKIKNVLYKVILAYSYGWIGSSKVSSKDIG